MQKFMTTNGLTLRQALKNIAFTRPEHLDFNSFITLFTLNLRPVFRCKVLIIRSY